MSVSIEGIDKIKLLEALWTNRNPASFYTYNPMVPKPKFDRENAARLK